MSSGFLSRRYHRVPLRQCRGICATRIASRGPIRERSETADVREAPARETFEEKRRRAAAVLRRLARAYPDARCSLDYSSPLQLLVATVLSAQCTDVRVNQVTPELFRKYRTAADYARAPAGELENDIRQTGFFNAKARSLRRAGAVIAKEHGGRVPQTMAELVALPGVGRKTANVILGNAFGKDEGFVVDTHVGRVSRRLGFTRQTDPVRVEEDLNLLVPKGRRTLAAHQLIFHGRQICLARRPRCEVCPVNPLCPKIGVPLEIRRAAVLRLPLPPTASRP